MFHYTRSFKSVTGSESEGRIFVLLVHYSSMEQEAYFMGERSTYYVYRSGHRNCVMGMLSKFSYHLVSSGNVFIDDVNDSPFQS